MTVDSHRLDDIGEGFVALDERFVVTRANVAIAHALGVAAEALPGKPLFVAAPALAGTLVEAQIRDAMAKRTRGPLPSLHSEGARWFELRAHPVSDGGLSLLFVDMTDRLLEGQRVGRELSRLVHDLRNPLTPLRTSLELLRRPTIAEETKARSRDIMVRQLAQLVGVIDELQDVARAVSRSSMTEQLANEPLESTAASTASIASPGHGPAHGARVLVADDSACVQQSVLELLRAEGYEVRTVSDGLEALAAAAEWLPHYVLLDVNMPRLGGIEAARQLRQAHPPGRMAILMMSGVTLDDAWRAHAAAAGFDACLDKTAEPNEWLAVLRRAGANVR